MQLISLELINQDCHESMRYKHEWKQSADIDQGISVAGILFHIANIIDSIALIGEMYRSDTTYLTRPYKSNLL